MLTEQVTLENNFLTLEAFFERHVFDFAEAAPNNLSGF
jgi:hypothetical protein